MTGPRPCLHHAVEACVCDGSIHVVMENMFEFMFLCITGKGANNRSETESRAGSETDISDPCVLSPEE